MADDSKITPPWDDDPDAVSLVQGRPEPVQPYTKLGDWVLLSGVSANACKLYWIYRMHVNHKRGDTHVWVRRRYLAALLGLAKASGVDPYNRELIAINAIEAAPRYHPNGAQRTNEYKIHMSPPDGYEGPISLADAYVILREGGELPRRPKPNARPKKAT